MRYAKQPRQVVSPKAGDELLAGCLAALKNRVLLQALLLVGEKSICNYIQMPTDPFVNSCFWNITTRLIRALVLVYSLV
jgi:hypothetical protein